MKQFTTCANVANRFFKVLQGYTKGIRFVAVLTMLLIVGIGQAWGAEETATLSFASTAQRVSQNTSQQVWSNDGITFTNNKGSSTSNVANYSNPVRLYQNSEIIVAHTSGKITKIVFDCNSSSYATAMKNSIGTISGATVSVSSDKATVTFTSAVASFTVAKLTAQVRLDAITVTYEVATEYNITYTGDEHITYSGTKPETITKEDSGFELEFSVDDGYKLNNVQVKMDGQDLVLDEDYLWEEGYLLILPGTDITGDIEIIFETVATCTNPTITTQPSAATYTKGATATPLKVVASGDDLTYQWYSNTSNSTSGATKIDGATNSTYTPSTSTVGTKYYYCIVSSGSCSTTSNIVSVVVKNPPFTVTLVPGSGSVTDTELEEPNAGDGVTLPTPTLNGCGDWEFAGWKTTSAVTTETTTEPTLIPAGNYNPSSNITLYAVYQRTETTEGTPTTTNTTDKLTRSTTGINNGAGYGTWSGKTANSSAVYAGQSAGGNDAIQLRTTNSNSGIITTASGGKAKKVTVEWQSNTAIGRTLDIYGKNSAYSAATDLYSTSTQGTKLGSIVNGTSTELTISGDYEYIGLRSNSNAMYLTSISIDWETTTGGGTTTTIYYHSTPDCGPSCEQLGAATGLTVETDFVHTDGQTYVKFSWTPADNTKANATKQKLCFGKVGEAGTCVDDLEKNLTWTGDLKSKLESGEYWWSIQALGDGVNYCDGDVVNGTNFTIEAPTYTVEWFVNGEEAKGTPTTLVIAGQKVTVLPTTPTSADCDDNKVFVGWTDKEINGTSANAPTNLYKELGDFPAINANTIYYAVFAEGNGGGVENVDATLSFESTAQRTTFTTSQQVWTQNGITLTNNKASSTSNVGDYSDPARFYKSSDITITAPGNITQIVFTCNTEAYATSLATSIGDVNLASGTIVTLILDGTSDSYEVTLSDGQVRMNSLTVTYTTGNGTSYSDYSTVCEAIPDPVWGGAVINRNSIKVDCGSMTKLNAADPNGPATISFPAATNHTLTYDITVAASEGFLVSTNKTDAAKYGASVTVSPNKTGDNAGKITQNVYVVAVAPAMSDEDFTGTITLSGKQLAENQVIDVTAYVTCTTYTLTLDDRGTKTTAEYYAGASVPKPADPEGVCTDPINYVFDGWSLDPVTDENTTSYEKVTFPFNMPGQNKTLYAVYRWSEAGGGDGDYHLVEEALDDWSGDYLIAYSNTIFADGRIGGKDEGIGALGVQVDLSSDILGKAIPASVGDEYNVTLEAITGGYLMKTKDGQYNYQSSNASGLSSTESKNVASKYPIVVDFVSSSDVKLCITNAETGSLVGPVFHYNTTSSGYFRFYKDGGQEAVYLYKKSSGTNYFTTSPVCGPHLEITAGKEIYVTGGNAGAARDLVMASQKVSYQATRLKTQDGSPEGTAPDVKVATNGITKGGVVTTEVKVTFENTVKELQPDDTYTITGDIVVTYEADANNMQEDIQVQLAVDYPANADARDNFIVHARSLPSEFVIVAKSGDKWYALNADMSSSKAQPANGQVTLNNLNNPTEATYAPCNAIYTFEAMPQGAEDRKSVRFIGMENKYLWAASEGNNGVQNYSKAPAADALAYNWKLYTEDNITYHFGNAQNTRMLGLHSTNVAFGMYANGASVVQDIRILPYVEKCIYNYAPTNLTVTDLKGTHVTLTWDGVVGATKYQYSDDATNWTDCGTEPTVTITGLRGGITYTYYIRAYHEDTGVSNECIDYEEITFTTADCDDVPTNISYSADLSTITVTWTASSATSTVKLYSDKEGTTVLQTTEGTNSVTFEGLIKNTQYYVQVFGGGSCASAIIPAKTKDVEMDIVEWDPQGIIVDVNTNEKIGVTLENEVAFGTGVGKKAEDIFFSKYFEANGTAKILAIYNGTDEKIDLSTVSILNDLSGQSLDLAEFGHKEVGYIYPNEEIILFNKGVEAVTECSEQQDSYPDWYNVEHGVLNFSGRATLILKRGDAVIDIIGSIETKGTNYPNDLEGTTIYNIAKSPTGENEKPSWGDDPGWVCESGDNIMTDVEETDYPLSTNRCLLVRKNTVVSGVNAVTNNIDKVFATLCDEWVGLQIPKNAPSTDNGVTESCEGMAFVGDFDYSSYYTKYVPIGGETTFEENQRNPDGTLTVPITDLYKQACRNIKVTLKDEHNEVIMTREYKVPIMITTDQATAYTEANKGDNAFYALQDNLATIEVDENGDEIERYPLTIEQVREICKTCDVVIRDKATLTKADDDDANDHPQVNNVFIYEGASLVIPDGTNETITSLSLRRKGDIVASAKVEEGGKLHLPASATAPIYLDMRIDANNWHWFTLPYNCNIADVTWVDGTPAQYNKDWFVMYYDGESRAASTNPYDNHWKVYNGTTIEAGKGYIVGIKGNLSKPDYTFELRFPMAAEVLTHEHTDKNVAVNAWGVKSDNTPNNLGWNLVGNPYLDYYKTSENISFTGLSLLKYTGIDPVTGDRLYDYSGNSPFLVTPINGGWYEYKQDLASDVQMMPFTAYFVQVGNPATHENGQALNASFEANNRGKKLILRRAPSEVEELEEPAIVAVSLTNAKGESDKTTLLIADRFTNEYEMNADFFKWFGDYYKYYTKPVLYTIGADQGKRAFNALSEELATQPVSLGMYAAQAGNYTFSLDLRSDLSKVQEVWLYDATQDTYTNLLQDSYTFQTAKTESAGRFFLSVKMAPKVSTNIDNIADGTIWATTQDHTIFVNGLLSNAQLWIYDATGKLLHTDQTQYFQHSYSVPISGTYFVRVQNTMQTQTIKVVVE